MKLLTKLYKFIENPSIQKIFLSIAIVATFIMIFLLNRLYPLFAEDWDYRFIWEWESKEPNKINGLLDILQSQYNHYMGWGGRAVVHAIDQLLLMMDTFWSDLINSLAFVAFICVIYKLANTDKPFNIFVFVFAASGIWLAQPVFPTTVLWLTGSANYLWGTLIIILFLYPFCKYYINPQKSENNGLKAVMLFLGGILAGWTNENMSITLIFILLVLLILMKSGKISIPAWSITGCLGAIAGCGLLILAPGNYARLAFSTQNEEIPFIPMLETRFEVLHSHFNDYLLLPTIIYIILLLIFFKFSIKGKRRKPLYLSLLFFIAACAAHLAMIATPSYPQRALFGLISLMIIAMLILYANIELRTSILKICNLVCLIVLLGYSGIGYYRDYRYLTLIDEFWEQRAIYVEQQKEKGIKDIVFEDQFNIYKSNFEFYELANFPDNWLNNAYARYYGVNSVRIKTEEERNK